MGVGIVTDSVESYAEMARRLWADASSPHGYRCRCIACADLRNSQRRILPVLIVAGHAIPTLPMGRRLP